MRLDMLRNHLVFLAIVLSLAGSFQSAFAWPHNPVENQAISLDYNSKNSISVVPDAAGGFFTVWEDHRGADADIYVTHTSALGLDLMPETPICNAAGAQEQPRAVSDGAGGVFVTWDDQRGIDRDIYAQHINSQGIAQWTTNGVVVVATPVIQEKPTIVPDLSGGAIVVWQDHRAGNSDIYAQGLDANGATQWTADGVVLCQALGEQVAPVAVSDGLGGAIMVWQDSRSGGEDIYAQRVINGIQGFLADGAAVCSAIGDQSQPVIASDGKDGAVIAWSDQRAGGYDVYASRVNHSGWFPWTPDGVAITTAFNTQFYPSITGDDNGGAYVAWTDYRSGDFDAYVQRVLPGGGIPWTADGVNLGFAPGTQAPSGVVADGAGGVIVPWQDNRFGGYDVRAQRLNSAGYFLWDYYGLEISTAIGDQTAPIAISDGANGGLFVWLDRRIGANQLYGQRVDRYGVLGEAAATIARVRDVPNDQGGHVKVTWNASYLDEVPYESIGEYWILRSVPAHALSAAQRTQLAALGTATQDDGEPSIIVTTVAGQNYYWELAGTMPTLGVPNYSFVAATTSDSITGSNPRTAFMIQARGYSGARWNSAPDSGYSVDNLVPAAPGPLAGAYHGGAIYLTWDPNAEPDIAAYRVYRGNTPAFVPAAGNWIGTVENPGYNDTGTDGSYYKVTAVDMHGNESPAALYSPNIVGVESEERGARLFLAAVTPNPTRGSMRAQWGLPAAGRATLEVMDLQGRRVRTLARGNHAAGSHAHAWDGRDDNGNLARNGTYFVLLRTEQQTLSRRVTLMR